MRVGFVRSAREFAPPYEASDTEAAEQCFAYCVSSILPGEEMERADSTTSVISRDCIPSGNTHTGISAKLNICALFAWQTSLPISERQMRTHATYVAGFDERTGRQRQKKEKAGLLSCFLSLVSQTGAKSNEKFLLLSPHQAKAQVPRTI